VHCSLRLKFKLYNNINDEASNQYKIEMIKHCHCGISISINDELRTHTLNENRNTQFTQISPGTLSSMLFFIMFFLHTLDSLHSVKFWGNTFTLYFHTPRNIHRDCSHCRLTTAFSIGLLSQKKKKNKQKLPGQFLGFCGSKRSNSF
jgi:hypothetical protein